MADIESADSASSGVEIPVHASFDDFRSSDESKGGSQQEGVIEAFPLAKVGSDRRKERRYRSDRDAERENRDRGRGQEHRPSSRRKELKSSRRRGDEDRYSRSSSSGGKRSSGQGSGSSHHRPQGEDRAWSRRERGFERDGDRSHVTRDRGSRARSPRSQDKYRGRHGGVPPSTSFLSHRQRVPEQAHLDYRDDWPESRKRPRHDRSARIVRSRSEQLHINNNSESDSESQAKRQPNVDRLMRELPVSDPGNSSTSNTSDSEAEKPPGRSDGEQRPEREPSSADSRSYRSRSRQSSESALSKAEGELSDSDRSTSDRGPTMTRRGVSGYDVRHSELSDSSDDDQPMPTDSDQEEERELPGEEEEEEGDVGQSDTQEVEEVERTPSPQLPSYLPATMGCRNVTNYEWLNKIEEGTYGVVFRGRDKKTDEIVALKKLKMEKEREGFPITSLREINMLLKASHPNVVHVREIVVGNNMDEIYIVMDFVEHDLKALMSTMRKPFQEGEVKTLLIQLLRAVHHLHDNWILHRDLKASNLLLSHKGILKVGDFGLAREYGSPLKNYTPVVVTLWYRAPELLLGTKEYSTPIDLWSVGCIFAELLQHKPLFMGKSEIDQLSQIFKELGTPSEEIWPGYSQLPLVKRLDFVKQPYNHLKKRFPNLSDNGFQLLNKFLTYDPAKRITAEDAIKQPYFQETPKPVDPSMFPTWPAKSEMTKRKRVRSPTAPEGGAFLLNQKGDDEDSGFNLVSSQVGKAAVGSGFTLKFRP